MDLSNTLAIFYCNLKSRTRNSRLLFCASELRDQLYDSGGWKFSTYSLMCQLKILCFSGCHSYIIYGSPGHAHQVPNCILHKTTSH